MVNAALLIWPLASLVLFRKLSPALAIAISVVGGYLLLPSGRDVKFSFFNLQRYSAIPPLDKDTMIAIGALAVALSVLHRSMDSRPGWIPRSPIAILLFLALIIGTFGTALSNGDPIELGWRTIPAIRVYDAVSMLQEILIMVIPFLLARKFLSTPDDHRTLLLVLAAAAIIYSLPVLYEVRMSPQLSKLIYGYFPHSFLQHIRGGSGWRPVVFLSHGLWLAIFLACASLASFGLWRGSHSDRRAYFFLGGVWLLFTLILSNNLGSLIILIMLLPVVIVMSFRVQVLGSAAVAILIIFYPILRTNGQVPTDTIIAAAQQIEPARAASFQTRVINEDMLLNRAMERPYFGWGGWGRSLIYTPSGRKISITDGRWIIILGIGGWFRYVGEMGLLTFAVLVLALRSRTFVQEPFSATLSVVLAANLIDLLPNSGVSPVTWLMAGALAGRVELMSAGTTVFAERHKGADAGLSRGGAIAYRRTNLAPTYSHDYSRQENQGSSPLPPKPERLPEGPRHTRFAPKPGDRS